MQSKLTLSIDKDVIVRAKHYAQENQQSVSSLVEAYLDRLSTAQKKDPTQAYNAPITTHLAGMFAVEDTGQEYKDLLADARMEKHV